MDEADAASFFEVVDVNSSAMFIDALVVLFYYRGFPHYVAGRIALEP
jgi:hypothetical protein